MRSTTQERGIGSRLTSDAPTGAGSNKASYERWTCPFADLELRDGATGEVRSLDCKKWACIEHGPRLAWRWRQRVGMVPWSLMLTLTLVPEDRDQARQAWARLRRWLKARGLRTYLRVMEIGHNPVNAGAPGMRHWHVLVDNLWVDQMELSQAAGEAGLGTVVWVSKVKDHVAATWYLLGYVFKSLGVDDERNEGWRKLTVSRNIPSWPTVLAARADAREPSADINWRVVGRSDGDLPSAHFYTKWLDRTREVFDDGVHGLRQTESDAYSARAGGL